MKLSIFTDELKLDLAEALPVIASWGLECCDLRAKILGKPFENLTDKERLKANSIIENSGMKVTALQSSLMKAHFPDQERISSELEKLENIIKAADVFDCRLVRSFFGWRPGKRKEMTFKNEPDKLEQVLDAFKPFAKRAHEAGLVLAFENCGVLPCDIEAFLNALDIPEWGIAWDSYNSWNTDLQTTDADTYIKKYVSLSRMIHVKAKSIIPEMGEAPLPWGDILLECASAGLEGPVSIETHNPPDSGLDDANLSRRMADCIRENWPQT